MNALYFIIGLATSQAGVLSEFQPLRPDEQLYSSLGVVALSKLPPYQQTSLWPAQESVRLFKPKVIPLDVKGEAVEWIERVVPQNKRPTPLEPWVVGVRGPLHRDVISIRYRLDFTRVQIQESETLVVLTVETPGGPDALDAESCKLLVEQVLREWVALPAGQHQHAKVTAAALTPVTSPQVFGGFIRIQDEGLNAGNRKWWNAISYSACESTVSLLISKVDGTQGYGTASTSAPEAKYIPRFGSG